MKLIKNSVFFKLISPTTTIIFHVKRSRGPKKKAPAHLAHNPTVLTALLGCRRNITRKNRESTSNLHWDNVSNYKYIQYIPPPAALKNRTLHPMYAFGSPAQKCKFWNQLSQTVYSDTRQHPMHPCTPDTVQRRSRSVI